MTRPRSRPRPPSRRRLRAAPAALALCASLASAPVAAQPPQPTAGELLRRIERLGVVGRVLYVAAHPDDENTRLLAYLVGERGLEAAYLSITRGDGGQNLIGAEQGPALGLIRTQELLAARRIDGAVQFFTRARDFGYSKTPKETLATWGHQATLGDVVWVIRRFRPDVVITRFPTTGFETHGHHTASAMLAEEAVGQAADPRAFPEQLALAPVWQVRRLLYNKSTWFLKPGEDLSRFLKLDTGGYDPVLGASWGEIAATSRSMHKSQGFGAAPMRGPQPEYFQAVLGDPPTSGVFDGLDLTWGRVPGAGKVAAAVKELAARFDPRRPEASIPGLVALRAELARLAPGPLVAAKLQAVDALITECAGLHVDVLAPAPTVVAGDPVELTAVVLNRSGAALTLEEVRLPGGVAGAVGKPLARHAPLTLKRTITVPPATPVTTPYWLATPPEKGRYPGGVGVEVGLPESPPPLLAEIVVGVGGIRLTLARPVVNAWIDPVQGERQRVVVVAPPISATPSAPTLMFPDAKARPLVVRLKASHDRADGRVRLALPPGFTATPAAAPVKLAHRDDEAEVRFLVRPPATAGAATGGTLRVVVETAAGAGSHGLLTIDYPHLPIQTLFPPAEVRLVRFDLKLRPGKTRIGYIAGAGDEVPAALRAVGYDVTLLDDAALAGGDLSRYGAIVVGVRAYNTNPRLAFDHARLMGYVAAGGTLVAQYSTNNRLARLTAPIGPYPFEISQERVTDEQAAVEIALPGHAVVTRPNRIGPADFDGWVQERGLYFAKTWSPEYAAPLAMHDPGEPPRRGGVLVARHGKGAFVYTGLAFFRQLPAGVPGAYRLFANLISYAP